MTLPPVPKEYSNVTFEQIVRRLQSEIEALKQQRVKRIQSVAAEAANNLAVDEIGYVLNDSQNFDLVARAQDGRLYRISGQASASAASSSAPAGVYVLKSGDTMTGLLILSGDPATALGAATKQYVDEKAKEAFFFGLE